MSLVPAQAKPLIQERQLGANVHQINDLIIIQDWPDEAMVARQRNEGVTQCTPSGFLEKALHAAGNTRQIQLSTTRFATTSVRSSKGGSSPTNLSMAS
jgi:hypothetical protein